MYKIHTNLSYRLASCVLAVGVVFSVFGAYVPLAYATTCANDGSVTFFVSGATCVGVITSTGTSQTFTAPSDWNNSNNKIETIGAGGKGVTATAAGNAGAGGGGGAYASTTNVTVSGTATFQIGAGAGTVTDTWFSSTATVDAGAGGNGSGTTGGTAGTVKAGHGYSGGTGGSGSSTAKGPGGGGGGAAGPGGAAVAGTGGTGGPGAATAGDGGSGGGGAGGTSGIGSIGHATAVTTIGGVGGSGNGGSGTAGTGATTACTSANNGSGGGGSSGGFGISATGTAGAGCNATSDTSWTVNSVTYGSGGGGGGGGSNSSASSGTGGAGGTGGTYGGGGGGGGSAKTTGGAGTNGGQGLIVITYTPIANPPTVTTNAASSVAALTATLNGNITATGGANATTRGFATSTNSTLSSGVATSSNSGSFGAGAWTENTIGLTGNTTFYFRAYATNPNGTSYGSILNFLTLPDVPGTPSLSSTVATSTTVTWGAPTGGTGTYTLQWCDGGCFTSAGLSVTSTSTQSLTGNTTYGFAVRGVNATGNGTYSATTTQLLVPDIPGAVSLSNLVATSTTINWSAPTGGTGTYTLQYCDGSCVISSGLSVTSTSSNPLVGNTTYNFVVKGHNATGDGLFTATTTQLTVPDVPTGLGFSGTTGTSTTLTWSAPTGGSSTYKIQRCTGASCTVITGVAGTTYNDTNTLSPNTTYGYQVLGTNTTGDGLYSATSSITTQAAAGTPGTPTFGTVTATTTVINWGASSPSADTYSLQQCDGGCPALFTGITSNSTTTYSLTGNTSYSYAVKGTNAFGTSAFSATSTQLTLPDVPTGLGFSGTTGTSTTISWSAPTGGASTYKLQRCAGGSCTVITGVSGTTYNDTGTLSGGTTYGYQVRGTNATGDGLYGATSSVTTQNGAGTPGTPTFGTVTATTTVLNWSASSPAADTYNLEQCVTGGGACSFFSGITSNSTTTYSLTGNTSYDYAVQGVSAYGVSAFSATSTQLTLPDVPGTPSFASLAPTTLTVNWAAPTGGASTYKVERCTGLGCSSFSQIASGVSSPTYNDSGLTTNTIYVYRIRATNATGDGLYSASAQTMTTNSSVSTPSITFGLGVRLRGGVRLK